MPLNLPRVQSAVVDATGRSTREWYDFFRAISEIEGLDAGLKKQINDIILRIEKIEKNGGLTFKLEARDSIAMEGLPSNGYVMFTLANDTNQPGNTFIYGTNALGEKGWHLLADGFEVVPESLTKTVDPETNITTYDLAEVTDAGGGQLLKIARDSKGRVTGTSTPTTDDLQEGASNLYFTDERARNAFGASDESGFLRGDKTWTNDLVNAIASSGAGAAFLFQNRSGPAAEQWGWYADGDIVRLYRSYEGDFFTFDKNTKIEFNGNSNADTRLLFKGGIGNPTHAASINFTTAGLDAMGAISFQMRDGANNFGRTLFLMTLSDGASLFGGSIYPITDNFLSVGTPSNRWNQIYATSGMVNTSDARDKTVIRPFSDTEIEAAKEIVNEIGVYQWLHSIDKKGVQDARHHIGFTVQKAMSIMQANGLDPFEYGFICHDSWEAQEEVLEDGKILIPERAAGDRYGFRYDQLNQFLMRGMAARLDDIEAKLTALSEKPDSSELVGV